MYGKWYTITFKLWKGQEFFLLLLHVFKSVHFNNPQLFCTVPKMYCIKDARLSKIHGKSSSESQICKSNTSTVARLDCMQPRVSIIWNYKPSLFFFVSHSPCTPSTKAAARVTYSAYKDESISWPWRRPKKWLAYSLRGGKKNTLTAPARYRYCTGAPRTPLHNTCGLHVHAET